LNIPLWILFLQGFATGFFTTWLGLVLVNIHPPIYKLAAVGLCYATSAMIIRSLPLPFGLHFCLLTILLVLFIQWIWRLTFIRALIPAVLGNLIMALAEALILSAILQIFNLEMFTILTNKMYSLLAPFPQILTMFLLAYFLSRRGIFLFNFDSFSPQGNPTINIQRNRLILNRVTVALILLVLQVFCIEAVYNFYPIQIFKGVSVEVLGIVMSVTLMVTTLILLYLFGQLVKLINRENEFLVQQTYLETVDEMVTAIRAQQHDQVSHLQTLYGYLQLKYFNEATQYLGEMIGEINLLQRFAGIEDVGLSALTYTKSAIASAQGIRFDISVNTDLKQLTVPPYELNQIISNLINNSFDHMQNLDKDRRHVYFTVDRKDNWYVFEVANHGHIDDHLAQNIFRQGVTSKTGAHAGLGLSIVERLVKNYGGKIIFTNEPDKVIFTVYLPIRGENQNESARPKISSPVSQEFAGDHLRG
jgi:two-component system sensor histidine kinase AgrC